MLAMAGDRGQVGLAWFFVLLMGGNTCVHTHRLHHMCGDGLSYESVLTTLWVLGLNLHISLDGKHIYPLSYLAGPGTEFY